MRPITLNLTLEQVLEFIHNLPIEYKEVVKKTLNEEKIEEKAILDTEIEESTQSKISIVDEILGIIQDDNLPNYKELRDAAIVENYKQKS